MRRPPAPPLFLVGPARSGTSLLYKSLSLHPDSAWISNWVRRFPGLPALGVLNRLTAHLPAYQRAVWFGGGDNAYVYGSRRRLAERVFPMPVEGEPFFTRYGLAGPQEGSAPVSTTGGDGLRAAVAAITRHSGGRVFISKRIANNWRIPALAACFPDGRFVELVRDGRAVAYSLSRVDWWDDSELVWLNGTPREWEAAGMDRWELCARNWVAELDAIAAGLAAVPPERRLRVAYEDA
jgi:omega-hydroxy-beta-dihydromenaquinone-9 sulfotransferase